MTTLLDRPSVVRTRELTKAYAGRTVVSGVDLDIPAGAVYGFLGPNGSGKTTTIRMLLGLVRPTSGGAELFGTPMPSAAASSLPRVGALVEGPGFHAHLSGRANLARLDAVDAGTEARTSKTRIAAALERVGLLPAADRRYRAYSLGMKQRLAIAGALLRPRDLLVLDEPTNGLDPQGTREIRSLVASLQADGATVLISSHLLSEVEQVCSHIGVMSAGRLVAQGEVNALRGALRPVVEVHTRDHDSAQVAAEVLRRRGLSDIHVTGAGATAAASSPVVEEPEHLVADLVAAGVGVRGFALTRPSLEDLFLHLTGEGFDVDG